MTATPQLPVPWEGLFLSPAPPWGVSIIARRPGPDGRPLVLVVQRDKRGSGVWGPPAGTRLPGEEPLACARRILDEVTGLTAPIVPGQDLQPGWATFAARVPTSASVRLGQGFAAFDWVEIDEALRRCGSDGAGAFALVA